MPIDLSEHKGVIYDRLYKARYPRELREDAFQEFSVYFYSYYKENKEYKDTTIINQMFSNWLAHEAIKYNRKKRIPPQALDFEGDHDKEWLEDKGGIYETNYEDSAVCDFVMEHASEDLQEWLLYLSKGDRFSNEPSDNTKNPTYAIAEREGKTRQAIEKRLRQELQAFRNTLGEK